MNIVFIDIERYSKLRKCVTEIAEGHVSYGDYEKLQRLTTIKSFSKTAKLKELECYIDCIARSLTSPDTYENLNKKVLALADVVSEGKRATSQVEKQLQDLKEQMERMRTIAEDTEHMCAEVDRLSRDISLDDDAEESEFNKQLNILKTIQRENYDNKQKISEQIQQIEQFHNEIGLSTFAKCALYVKK